MRYGQANRVGEIIDRLKKRKREPDKQNAIPILQRENGEIERETERQRDRDTERQRETERDRERERDRETERKR